MLARPRESAWASNASGTSSGPAAWQPVGPLQVGSLAFGNVTGRITAIAIDLADTTGNTIYLGTTGGGVWKSTSAAGPAAGVRFVPLTDTLPVFSLDSGHSAIASLSIGALSVANGVVLAGTGDPNDALDSYSGSGILRSADGGATWTLAQQSNDGSNGNHSFVGLGFAGLARSTVSPTVAVAALSDAVEGELVNAVDALYSVRGLYYSSDSGVTWQMATVRDGGQTVQQPLANGQNLGGNSATAVVWNPVRQRFYAALRYHGYYESTDGAVWTRLAAQPGAGLTNAACPPRTGTTGSLNCPIFRGALAVEPESGDTYAFTIDAGDGDRGIWRDSCAAVNGSCANSPATFATRLGTAQLEQGAGATVPQGDYNLSLSAVASGSDTLLYAGTVDLFRCTLTTASFGSAGCAFRNTTNVDNGCNAPARVAPAQHALAVFAGTPAPVLFIGNDGGLWRSPDGVAEQGSPCSTNDANHFENLNGGLGSLAEVVQFSQHPSDSNMLLVGLGANGTAATSTASANSPWPQLANGEGGFSAIDSVSPSKWYASTAAGVSITYCGRGSSCAPANFKALPTIGAPQVTRDVSLIDPPWLLDPNLSTNVLIGTCRVWRGPAAVGSAWPATNVLSSNFGGQQNAACNAANPFIRSLAAGGPLGAGSTTASSGSVVLYAGLAGMLDGGGSLGGHVFSTTAANTASSSTAWADLAESPVTNDAANGKVFNPNGFDISSVAVDPHDATGKTVYATVMGFAGNGLSVPHAYRSTDGGGHWTNIGANLPEAPANSIVVDPNDPNTVYIAMDTGVYATRQVASCATSSCWSVFGAGLPNAPVIQLVVSAALPTGGTTSGELRAATYGRGIWQIPLLTAAPATSADLTLAPGGLVFPAQALGTTSASQAVTVTNTGNALLTVTGISATGDFSETDDCVGTPIAVRGSCSAQVVFSPTAVGPLSGVLTVVANVPGGQASAALNGAGASPAAIVTNPSSLNFGTLPVGSTAAAQSITVENSGGVAATLQSESVTGDFQIVANDCGAGLAAGSPCTVTITFTPASVGIRNGSFTVVDSAGTQLVSLTGNGATPATDTLSPTSLVFSAQMAGSTSAERMVSLTNSGDSTLNLLSARIATGDFTLINDCAGSLPGHSSCSFQVAFAPTTVGALSGTLVVTDQFGSQTVSLTGSAVAIPTVALNPNALTFRQLVVGQLSTAQQIFVTNAGTGSLTVGSISITGDFTETDNCANRTLYAAYSCDLQITFAPTAAGPRAGMLTVNGMLSGQIATASLSGSAVTPAAIELAPGSLSYATVVVGATGAAQSVVVTNTGGAGATLLPPTVSGDFQIAATSCGAVLASGANCFISVAFAPLGPGVRSGVLSLAGSGGTRQVALTGTGASPPTGILSPLSISFAPQQAGTISAAQTVTLTNTGDTTLGSISASIATGDFTLANGCGTSLAGHSSCAMQVAFAPTRTGSFTGSLAVTDHLNAQTVPLSGTAYPPPTVALSPAAVNFPVTTTGQTSASQSVVVSNSGGGQLTVSSIAVAGDYTQSSDCAGKILSSTVRCTVTIAFAPIASGTRSGTLTIRGTNSGQQATAVLSGTGVAPARISLSPMSLSFTVVPVGTTSAPQNIAISNIGGVAATLQSASITGDFQISANTCGSSLAPGVGCTVSVVFAPTATGARAGTFTLQDSIGMQTASLTGTAKAAAMDTISPMSLTFAAQQTGTLSLAQAVTLTNGGDAGLTLISARVTSGEFTVTSGCGTVLAGHSSCVLLVVYAPTMAGAATGNLTVADQLRSQTIALTGSAFGPAAFGVAPAALSFPLTVVGQTSALQMSNVSNTGGGQLTLAGIAVTGDFTETDNCSGKVLSGTATCVVQVNFSPTASGSRTGALLLTGPDAGQKATVALTGMGATPAAIVLNPTNFSFGSVRLGSSSAAQNLTISNTGGVAADLTTITVTGDFNVSTETCGKTLAAGTGCTVSVLFTPTASGTRTGTLSVMGSVGTQTATLTGTGASPPTDALSPLTLSFGPQDAGTSSAAQPITLSNAGDEPLTSIALQVSNASFTAMNGCSPTLKGHENCIIQVSFVPTVSGPLTATLTVSDSLQSQSVALSGTGVAPPMVAATPGSIRFASTAIGQNSSAQTVMVSNSGGGQIMIASVAATGDFTATDNCAGKSLNGTTTCAVQVLFAPTATGTRSGVLTITGTGSGQQATIALSGSGVGPAAIVLDPLSLTFGAITLGSSSAVQNLTISNTGGVAATIVGMTVSGDFSITADTCGASLAPSGGCTASVAFTPTASGSRAGTFAVTDSVGTQTAALTGTATSAATDTLAPVSLTFAAQQINTTGLAQSVTLTNAGDNALTLITAQITAGDFTASSSCGSSLVGHASCAISVAAVPTKVGPGTGVLTVSDQFRSQTVALYAVGVAPPGVTLSPTSGLTFAPTGITTTSAAQTVTLSNQGGEQLTIAAITATGDFSIPATTNTCADHIASSASCTFQIVFAPTVEGTRNGTVSVMSNAPGSAPSLTLQGVGVDFSLTANGATSVTTHSGQTAVYPLLLASAAGTPGTATLACTGAPTNATCVVAPAGAPMGSSTPITVTVATGVTVTAMTAPQFRGRGLWLAMVLPFLLPLRGIRRLRDKRMPLLALACMVLLAGCGSGRTIPGDGAGGGGGSGVATPSGTYSIVVAASSAGLTRSVKLTLIVQ